MPDNAFEILKKDGKESHHLRCMQLLALGFRVVTQAILEYHVKFAKLALYQVLGFVEDEHYINTLSFTKGKLTNHPITCLDLCVKMF
jgi:hypothetical protein